MNSDKLNELSKNIHSPVPFWFLNGQVDEWHIVREFEMMREKGIGDVIVHPRYGLQVEYLSEEWFTIFGWCVREAKKHGMHVWIYDEFNWPSGTAGMTVMQNDPDYQGKYLAVETKPLSEIDLTAFQPGLYIIAANIEGDYVTKTRLLDGIESLKALTGEWRIFNCTLKHDRFYIDTLSKNAVDCFKRVTYDEYYKRFGDEFGEHDPRDLYGRTLDLLGERGLRRLEPALHRRLFLHVRVQIRLRSRADASLSLLSRHGKARVSGPTTGNTRAPCSTNATTAIWERGAESTGSSTPATTTTRSRSDIRSVSRETCSTRCGLWTSRASITSPSRPSETA